MALVYCIDLKASGLKEGAICVPILKKTLWPWEIWAEVFRHIQEPPMAQWVIDEQLDQIVMQDLIILATIDEVANDLSSGMRRGVKEHIKKAVEQVDLPEGRRVQHR